MRIPLSVRTFKKLDPEETFHITQQELKDVICNFKLPPRFINDKVLQPILDQFTDKNDPHKINYKNFIEHLADYRELNDFFNYKEKHLDKLKDKIAASKEQVKNSVILIKKEEEKKHELLKELEKNIKLHEEVKEKEKQDELKRNKIEYVNNCQPSKEFNELLFKNKEKINDKYKEFESKFSAHPSLRKEIKAKTRYGANPEIKSTAWITSQDPKSGMFINEHERFNNKDNYFQQKEKMLRENKHKNKINIIKFYTEQKDNKSAMSVIINEQKKMYSLLQRTEKMYKYELINKNRNELIE